MQRSDGSDDAVKPTTALLEQAGLEASPQRDVTSHSMVAFVIEKVTRIFCSDHAVHESA